MGQQIEPVFEEIYVSLNAQNRESLKLYAEFLLALQQKKVKGKKKTAKTGFLEDMESIDIPVDNVIIDRAAIYDDRF
jgi:stress response protein YsnF